MRPVSLCVVQNNVLKGSTWGQARGVIKHVAKARQKHAEKHAGSKARGVKKHAGSGLHSWCFFISAMRLAITLMVE